MEGCAAPSVSVDSEGGEEAGAGDMAAGVTTNVGMGGEGREKGDLLFDLA